MTRRILDSAPGLRATFHRAFDDTEDKLIAIRDLLTLPQVDRILTSGGPANLTQQIHNLAVYDKVAAGRITILAGGGMDRERIAAIRNATPIRDFHVGRAVRVSMSAAGAVSSERVNDILGGLLDS